MNPKHQHHHRPKKTGKHGWQEKGASTISPEIRSALFTAIQKENVPENEFNDLLWIMAQESGGKMGVQNPVSSARGLFQLLKAQYELNPNGEKSFGNPVEECQGGIRYIMGRYHSAAKAKQFWQSHHWY